jgi:hypothetical protein
MSKKNYIFGFLVSGQAELKINPPGAGVPEGIVFFLRSVVVY